MQTARTDTGELCVDNSRSPLHLIHLNTVHSSHQRSVSVGRCKAAKCPKLTFRVTKSRPECLWRHFGQFMWQSNSVKCDTSTTPHSLVSALPFLTSPRISQLYYHQPQLGAVWTFNCCWSHDARAPGSRQQGRAPTCTMHNLISHEPVDRAPAPAPALISFPFIIRIIFDRRIFTRPARRPL